jgi:hypothetical protein
VGVGGRRGWGWRRAKKGKEGLNEDGQRCGCLRRRARRRTTTAAAAALPLACALAYSSEFERIHRLELLDPDADELNKVGERRDTHGHVRLRHAAEQREHRLEEGHAQRHVVVHDALHRVGRRARDPLVGMGERLDQERAAFAVDHEMPRDGRGVEER